MIWSSDLAPRELGTDQVVGGDDRADEMVVDLSKLSKSWEIVKSRKTSKAWKFAKIISLEKHLPKHRSSVEEFELSLELSNRLTDALSHFFSEESDSIFLHQIFVSKMHVFLPLNFGDPLQKDVLA